MRIVQHYSHLNGLEYLMVHHPRLWTEIQAIIKSIDATKHRTKISKEKTMMGKSLYSPPSMNAAFKEAFIAKNWKEQRTSYWVTDDVQLIRKTIPLAQAEQKADIIAAGKTPILSYNQTDFVKNRVAVEVQFGKYSFVAYDLFVKHMAFYVGDVIDLGIEILPMKELQADMSSGPGYYEGELYMVHVANALAPGYRCDWDCLNSRSDFHFTVTPDYMRPDNGKAWAPKRLRFSRHLRKEHLLQVP